MAWRFKTKEELRKKGHWCWVSSMDYLCGLIITDEEARIINETNGYHKSWYSGNTDGRSKWKIDPNMIIEEAPTQKIGVGDIVEYPHFKGYEFEVLEFGSSNSVLCYSKKFSEDGNGHGGHGPNRKEDSKGHWNIDLATLKLINKQLHNDADVRTIDQHRSDRGTSTTICSGDIQLAKSGRPTGREAASFKFGSQIESGKINQNWLQLD
jgi:hypothetical protein